MTGTNVEPVDVLQAAESLLRQRNLPEAIAAYRDAQTIGADADACSAGRWMAYMLDGDFAAAWRESDAIRARGADDPHRFWLGEEIGGRRVIVRCLHGLGDAVQMLRFIPMLRAQCEHVTVEVPPRLLEIAGCFEGVVDAITWGDAAPASLPAWDVQMEVMELPYVFRIDAGALPLRANYVSPPPVVLQQVKSIVATSAPSRVGLIWCASEWDTSRCLPMDCVARIAQVQGITWWNLQGGEKHRETIGHPSLKGVHDAAGVGDGVATLAAVIASLDLVITVDTLAAHLAGALGKPVWLLLQHAADWRWMHGRTDSPWYPTMRIWRQPVPGDWESLTAQVCSALQQWRGALA